MRKLAAFILISSVLSLTSLIRPEPVMACGMDHQKMSCCSTETDQSSRGCGCVEQSENMPLPEAIFTTSSELKITLDAVAIENSKSNLKQNTSSHFETGLVTRHLFVPHDPPHLRAPPILL